MCAVKGGEDLFPLDDDGFSVADGITVPSNKREFAIRGARVCPERAISLLEENTGKSVDLD